MFPLRSDLLPLAEGTALSVREAEGQAGGEVGRGKLQPRGVDLERPSAIITFAPAALGRAGGLIHRRARLAPRSWFDSRREH